MHLARGWTKSWGLFTPRVVICKVLFSTNKDNSTLVIQLNLAKEILSKTEGQCEVISCNLAFIWKIKENLNHLLKTHAEQLHSASLTSPSSRVMLLFSSSVVCKSSLLAWNPSFATRGGSKPLRVFTLKDFVV